MESDSSSDEDLAKFQEAADPHLFSNELFLEKPAKTKVKNPLPSLRSTVEDAKQFTNSGLIPEFQTHIAKILEQLISSHTKIIKKSPSPDDTVKKKRKRGGVKLFRNSEKFLKLDLEASGAVPTVMMLKRKVTNDEEFLKELEDNCQSVVVDSKDVLSQKDIKAWSNRSKAPIYNYKQTKSGLELIERPFQERL